MSSPLFCAAYLAGCAIVIGFLLYQNYRLRRDLEQMTTLLSEANYRIHQISHNISQFGTDKDVNQFIHKELKNTSW